MENDLNSLNSLLYCLEVSDISLGEVKIPGDLIQILAKTSDKVVDNSNFRPPFDELISEV